MKRQLCTVVFLRKEDQVLLAMKKRGFGSGRWNGAGGKVEPDETKEQAMVRECQEEIAVTPQAFTKVAFLDFINKDKDNQPYAIEVHGYICTKWQGTPTETEEMAPRWFAIADIPYTDMWADDEFWLPQVLAGHKVCGQFEFNQQDQLLSTQVEVVDSL